MRERGMGQPAGDEGFALILAILALMLLTMLGLALATTTSTELQIATNYRWSQQALYNAEAGIEAGKAILQTVNWQTALPAARLTTAGAPWNGRTAAGTAGGGAVASQSRNDAWGNPTRNFENSSCDLRGFGMGYGVVLDDASPNAPYQYVSTALGQNLNGAFTLWIRRPLNYRTDTQLEDWSADNNNLILVSEGVAPFTGGNITSGFGQANRAVQVMEVALSSVVPLSTSGLGCGSRGGQVGGSPLGGGFGSCEGVGGGAAVTGAMAGAATGTGGELNPNQ